METAIRAIAKLGDKSMAWLRSAGESVAFALVFAPMLAAASSPVTAPVYAPDKLELDVLADFNAARTQPTSYAAALRAYRGYFHQKVVVVPGAAANFQTEEGVVPVDEAIGVMTAQATLPPLEYSALLSQSAADHVADQSVSGKVGHIGADGSTPGMRAVRRGGGKGVAEVIAYGAIDAADVIRQLVIDDGVADRGHRVLMLSTHLRYAGVACGPHPEFRTVCVIDMADTTDGRSGAAPARIAARDIRAQR